MIGAEAFVVARDHLAAHVRAERLRRLADGGSARVLVLGEWSGTTQQAARELELDPAEVTTAFNGQQTVRLIDARRTFDLVWLVGDFCESLMGGLTLVVATELCAPGALVVCLVRSPGILFAALPWDRVEMQRYPQIGHALVFATMSEKPKESTPQGGPRA